MQGIYGYDMKNSLYWYKITYMNVEVQTGKNLTRKEMTKVLNENKFCLWNRDYNYKF